MAVFQDNLFKLLMIMIFGSTLSVILKNGLNNMEQTNPKLIQGIEPKQIE